jgi:hypothetical protein
MTPKRGDNGDRGDRFLDRLPSWREDTYATRLARLHRRNRQVVAVGVALTAFVVALAAGDSANGIYGQVPGWLRATIFTLVVAAGAGLALAYIRYEEEATLIERAIAQDSDQKTVRIGDRWPKFADAFWIGALVCTTLAPLAFLTAAWWAAFF